MSNITNNFFDLLNLTPLFTIDKQVLDRAYRQLQQVSHPDRFINQPTEFQRRAVQQTALNTEAYQTLKSPVLRACHLLNVLGLQFNLSNYTVTDIDLLMQQMEYREQLSAIKDSADFDQLQHFSAVLKKLTNSTVKKIADLFDRGVDAVGSEANASAVKNYICELQFLNKLALDLDEVEEQLLMID